MATIDRRPNGKWRAQVRREGHVLSKTFVMKGDADAWVRDTERATDKGEDPTARRFALDGVFSSLIDQRIDDLTIYGKRLRRSKDAALTRLKRELGSVPLAQLTRDGSLLRISELCKHGERVVGIGYYPDASLDRILTRRLPADRQAW